MKTVYFLLAILAVVSANPAVRKVRPWENPRSKLTPNFKATPIENLVQYVAPPHKRISPKFGKAVKDCGLPGSPDDSRIVNGETASPHEFPWQAAIYVNFWFVCGGTLINDEWVLTAADCTTLNNLIVVNLGVQNRVKHEDSQLAFGSTNIITHEKYDPLYIHNNIGLIKLPVSLTYTNAIRPICLPAFSDPEIGAGEHLEIAGWGTTTDPFDFAEELQKVTITTMSNDDCIAIYGSDYIIYSVGCIDASEGKTPCIGDYGGSLITKTDAGISVSRALFSFIPGNGCLRGLPSGFTRIKYFLDWISIKTGIFIDP